MSQPKITFAWSEDGWEGMYVDGVLKLERHSLDYGAVLEALGIDYDSVHANEEALERTGCLPPALADLVEEDEED